MRKVTLLMTLAFVFLVASTSVYAQERYALGKSNIALKGGYINFTEDTFENVDLDDGAYVGLEAYTSIVPNIYIGFEAAYAGTQNDDDVNILGETVDVDTDVRFVPLELNLKFAGEVVPNLTVAIGGGASYSWFELDVDVGSASEDEDDWVWGGQAFAEVDYKITPQWFVGIDGKYQWTEDLEDSNTSADNWRVGAKIGWMF